MNIQFQERFTKAINDEISKIIEEEAVEAGKRVEKRVKERTAQIAANVLTQFSFERSGQALRIEVFFNQ